MAQVVRWYLTQLEESPAGSGRVVVNNSLRSLVQGRWTSYRLPNNWALVRVRGELAQHVTLGLQQGCIPWPRGTGRFADLASARLKLRLAQLGAQMDDNESPRDAIDRLGRFHQQMFPNAYRDKPLFSRLRERRADEEVLGAVED